MENSNLFGELFTAISRHQVIELHYHRFSDCDTIFSLNVHPYLLKEYNRRWYLFAAAEIDEKLLCFSLDRIDKILPLPSHKYVEYEGDINEHFDDIIGVTLYSDSPIYNIYFWVSDYSMEYVATKPLHESQKNIRGEQESILRKKYSSLAGGRIFRIDCKFNYELIRELASFGKELIVLEPSRIQSEVYSRISEMYERYKCILEKCLYN